jgi:glycosyltransferase involved in cell wall biosynthesis
MKLSIVTAYRNRRDIFKRVLESVNASAFKDFEFIAVDDASEEEHRIEDLQNEFKFLKVVRIEPEKRIWCNPCVPFNKAIDLATADIILLQTSECIHTGDIINNSMLSFPLKEKAYRSIGCYSLDKPTTDRVAKVSPYQDSYYEKLVEAIGPTGTLPVAEGILSWYQHSRYRNTCYHFATFVHRKILTDLNGFDERFATGHCFDDDEFICRLQRYGVELECIDFPFVAHQYHYDLTKKYETRTSAEVLTLYDKNRYLWYQTLQEKGWKANRLFSV